MFIFVILLILFFLYPFLSLLFYIQEVKGVPWAELSPILANTVYQSLGSAVLSLFLGFFGARGLLYLQAHPFPFWRRHYKWIELWLLLPNFLPTLFLILPTLKWIWPLTSAATTAATATATSTGPSFSALALVPLVALHTLANTGLLSVGLARSMKKKGISAFALLAQVEGASFFQFLSPLLRYLKKDLFLFGFFVFSLSFSSFSAPLLLAGEHGVTLELFIYQKLRGGGNEGFSQALFLALLQSLFLFGLSYFLLFFRPASSSASPPPSPISPLLTSSWGWIVPCCFTLFILWGQVAGCLEGWGHLQELGLLKEASFWASLLGTLRLGLLTGASVYFLLLLLLFLSPQKGLQNFLMGYTTPSSALTGLAFFLLFPSLGGSGGGGESGGLGRLALSLCLCFFPYLYRLHWHSHLQTFQRQREVALTLGASKKEIFFFILLPQSSSLAAYMAGIAAFWACGDFALSQFLAGNETHLAMLMSSLLSRHHLSAATALAPLLLFLSFLCYFLFWFLGHVHRKKSFF